MAISYPVTAPTVINPESVEFRARNVTAMTRSVFTLREQVYSHAGDAWEVSVTIPQVRRDLADEWVSFLMSLKGMRGTFLLGDPNAPSLRGTATSLTVSGNVGDETVDATLNGTLLAGDYIQLGTGDETRLHKILVNATAVDTQIEIWPSLRADYTDEVAVLEDTKCLFRLSNNVTNYGINSSSVYSISFEAMEALG